jgi:hypothetical protein
VDPGALISNICHLEEVLIDPGLTTGFPEHRFVGSGRARSHNDTIQFMFYDRILNLPLGVLGTGIKVVLNMDDVS